MSIKEYKKSCVDRVVDEIYKETGENYPLKKEFTTTLAYWLLFGTKNVTANLFDRDSVHLNYYERNIARLALVVLQTPPPECIASDVATRLARLQAVLDAQ